MTSVTLFLDRKIVPRLKRLNNQRHFSAISDTLYTIIPLLIAGGLLMVFGLIIFGYNTHQVSVLGVIAKLHFKNWSWNASDWNWPNTIYQHISQIGGLLFTYAYQGTLGAVALLIVIVLPFFLSVHWLDPIKTNPNQQFNNNSQHSRITNIKLENCFPSLIALASFGIVTMGKINFFMGGSGILVALISTIVSTEIFFFIRNHYFVKSNSKTKKNYLLTDRKLFNQFWNCLWPTVITLLLISFLNLFFLIPALLLVNWNITSNQSFMNNNVWNKDINFQAMLDWIRKYYPSLADNTWIKDQTRLHSLLDQWGNKMDQTTMQNLLHQIKNNLTPFGWKLFNQFVFTTYLPHHLIAGWQSGVGHFSVSTNGLSFNYEIIKTLIDKTHFGFAAGIYKFCTFYLSTFLNKQGSLGIAVIFVLLTGFSWWIGVNIKNPLNSIFGMIWLFALNINAWNIIHLNLKPHISDNSNLIWLSLPIFEAYIFLGGAGAILAFNLINLFKHRNFLSRKLARFNLVSSVFNLAEPTILTQRIIFNLVYLVPFCLGPILNLIWVYIFINELGIVSVSYIATTEYMPVIVAGMLSSGMDPWSIILTLICLLTSIIVYLPFIWIDNLIYLQKIKTEDSTLYKKITKIEVGKKINKIQDKMHKVTHGRKKHRIYKKLNKLKENKAELDLN